MSLAEYNKKRDFRKTPEPSGESTVRKSSSKLIYVIQKHRATQLHYDFRLEWAGVLLSWAVPKGPSLDPSVKRLAMQVEDHPIDYADFEGVIPADEYGGGTVMVWDIGTWEPEVPNVDEALKKGDLKFQLFGKKLQGSWVLVRTFGFGSRSKPSWLLIKHRDQYASERDITRDEPESMLSHRLLSDIARDNRGNVEQAATGDPQPSGMRAAKSSARSAAKKTGAKRAVRKRSATKSSAAKSPSVWHSNRPER
jgi:bifunctional non-homologous end joining protein LigD